MADDIFSRQSFCTAHTRTHKYRVPCMDEAKRMIWVWGVCVLLVCTDMCDECPGHDAMSRCTHPQTNACSRTNERTHTHTQPPTPSTRTSNLPRSYLPSSSEPLHVRRVSFCGGATPSSSATTHSRMCLGRPPVPVPVFAPPARSARSCAVHRGGLIWRIIFTRLYTRREARSTIGRDVDVGKGVRGVR